MRIVYVDQHRPIGTLTMRGYLTTFDNQALPSISDGIARDMRYPNGQVPLLGSEQACFSALTSQRPFVKAAYSEPK